VALVLDKRAGDCLNRSSLDNFGGGRAYNIVGRKDLVCLFLPLDSPVGALRRQGRYLLHGITMAFRA